VKFLNIRKICSYWKEIILTFLAFLIFSFVFFWMFFVFAEIYFPKLEISFPEFEVSINRKYGGKKIERTEIAEYKYVASALKEPFHYPTCMWAEKIIESNLVGFKTRQEALDYGRLPCKVCQP